MAIEAKAASPTSQCRLTKGHLGLLKSSIYSLHFSVQPQPFFTTTAATCVPTILSGLSDIASADLAALYKYQNLNFRLCDYLPATSAPFGANSCGVYTDYGTISVIFQDAQPGLEAEAPDHPDSWIPILGNATIVLCGWYTLILSGGRVRAVRHRVRRVLGVRKLSTVLFVAPDMEVDLKPLEADKGSRAFSEAIMEVNAPQQFPILASPFTVIHLAIINLSILDLSTLDLSILDLSTLDLSTLDLFYLIVIYPSTERHKMAPYMIHTSFQHELYQLNVPPVPNNYRQTHSTAASTINTDAPRALETEDEEPIIVLARNSLWNIRANSRLRERIPQNEGTHSLRTEADVLDASRLYLLHPVNVAVNELLKNGRLECRREHVASSTSRTDILWVHIHNDQTTNIAVLEFKNAFILRKADFSPAMVNASEAERALAKTFATNTETLLTGNAYWLSKQAVKYHEELQTADVAIFDWNNMVVFDFSGMSETPNNPKLARAIWFSEAGKNHNQHQTFRALLLGFLIRALRRSNLVN